MKIANLTHSLWAQNTPILAKLLQVLLQVLNEVAAGDTVIRGVSANVGANIFAVNVRHTWSCNIISRTVINGCVESFKKAGAQRNH